MNYLDMISQKTLNLLNQINKNTMKQSARKAYAPFAHVKVSQMLPLLKIAAVHYDLNVSSPQHMITAVRLVKHQANNN